MKLSNEWETYTIDLSYDDLLDDTTDSGRMEVTDEFEADLAALIKKYQGRAGIKFDVRNSLEAWREEK